MNNRTVGIGLGIVMFVTGLLLHILNYTRQIPPEKKKQVGLSAVALNNCRWYDGHVALHDEDCTAIAAVMFEPPTEEPRITSNQTMKPMAPPRNAFSVFATTPCRGLPQLLLQNSWVK